MDPLQANATIEHATRELAEFFDSVQILVSWEQEGQTPAGFRGAGNWYSRQGVAQEFVNRREAEEIGYQVAKQLGDQDESI